MCGVCGKGAGCSALLSLAVLGVLQIGYFVDQSKPSQSPNGSDTPENPHGIMKPIALLYLTRRPTALHTNTRGISR
jgi:hypothetical protein